MLLWFLKDQRVYLHNVLFLACFNWEYFQGVKMYKIAFVIFRHLMALSPRCKGLWHHDIKPMYKIAFVIFCHLIALPSRTWAYGTFSSSWSLWQNLVHHRTRVVCLFSRTLDDCLPGLFWTEPRKTLVRNSAHSDLGLTQCLLVVKARLKPAYN